MPRSGTNTLNLKIVIIINRKNSQGLHIVNLTIKSDAFLSIFPTGDYQLHLFYYSKLKAEATGFIKIIFSILSSIKDNFG